MSTQDSMSTFHPFPRLPAELRITIYKHVLAAKPILYRSIHAEGVSYHHFRHHFGELELVDDGEPSPPSTPTTAGLTEAGG